MRSVSDIKLIRTDTTLDLSQKAEKVQLEEGAYTLCTISPGIYMNEIVGQNTEPENVLNQS